MIWHESYGLVPALLRVERGVVDGGTLDFAQATHAHVDCAAAVTLVAWTLMATSSAQRLDGLLADGRRRNDTDGIFDVHEHVHERVVGDRESIRVAGVTQVKVSADHALVASAVDGSLARVAFVGHRSGRVGAGNATRFADVTAEWAWQKRAKTLLPGLGIVSDGRLRATDIGLGGWNGRLGLGWVDRFKCVWHVGVGGLNVSSSHTRVALNNAKVIRRRNHVI